MKNLFLSLLLTSFVTPAFARTTYVNGNGRESGFCSSVQGNNCIRMVEERAVRAGTRDAEWRCQTQGGNPITFSARCNTSCFPTYIPPNTHGTTVRCTSSCTIQCVEKH